MEFTDLQDFISKEENKDQFVKLVKELGFESKEEVSGLRNKRDELLGVNKKLKEKNQEYEKMLDKIDVEEYYDLKNKSGDPEINKIKREAEKYKSDYETLKQDREALEAELSNTLVKSTLSGTLDEIGIDPKHKNLIISAHIGKAKVEKTDSGRTVLIDDGDGLGLPINDYFKKFAESETGKVYLKQPENKGANSSRFSGSGTNKQMATSEFKKLSGPEQSKFMSDGGSLI